ncbi:DUF2947 family protein [Chryseobacterium sp. POL2]|uniref:DUF2947 family protein n=1 Tax=Chryseobacterium sp. POL2 TaxID=2713414 RepID=UPI0013E117C1|nr:DUF2947 family protein [Chryseobacterium sp. POL2]QIG88657.1 DUF2947 family protein [Chryseobacterium sp. POL2]
MDIKIDSKEIIPFEDFDLGWRFSKSHNSDISDEELKQILPLSETESKRLNKVIDFYEIESNRILNYQQTDWFRSSQENDEKIENFRNNLAQKLSKFDEDLIISWNRKTTLKTNKTIFLKYWTDFLYPSSDDVTIISEKTNWILFFSHYEVSNLWIKNNNVVQHRLGKMRG